MLNNDFLENYHRQLLCITDRNMPTESDRQKSRSKFVKELGARLLTSLGVKKPSTDDRYELAVAKEMAREKLIHHLLGKCIQDSPRLTELRLRQALLEDCMLIKHSVNQVSQLACVISQEIDQLHRISGFGARRQIKGLSEKVIRLAFESKNYKNLAEHLSLHSIYGGLLWFIPGDVFDDVQQLNLIASGMSLASPVGTLMKAIRDAKEICDRLAINMNNQTQKLLLECDEMYQGVQVVKLDIVWDIYPDLIEHGISVSFSEFEGYVERFTAY